MYPCRLPITPREPITLVLIGACCQLHSASRKGLARCGQVGSPLSLSEWDFHPHPKLSYLTGFFFGGLV